MKNYVKVGEIIILQKKIFQFFCTKLLKTDYKLVYCKYNQYQIIFWDAFFPTCSNRSLTSLGIPILHPRTEEIINN